MELHLCKEMQIRHSEFLRWDPEDQAKALAFLIEEGQRCASCGTATWEWEENPYAYEPVAQMCKGCYLKDTANEDSKNLPGTTIALEPTALITYAMREQRVEREKRAMKDALDEFRR